MNTREEWLLKGTEILRQRLFTTMGTSLPEVKVSVGFPIGSRATGDNQVRGQIWEAKSTADNVAQIFISPQVDSPFTALAILTHELCHACTPGDGHGSKFRELAIQVGLTGPMRSTEPGPELTSKLNKLVSFLGPYPHAAVNLNDRKKQETRLLKMICRHSTGYTVRITQKWLAKGAPQCPCHNEHMIQEAK